MVTLSSTGEARVEADIDVDEQDLSFARTCEGSSSFSHMYRVRVGDEGRNDAESLGCLDYLRVVGNLPANLVDELATDFPALSTLGTLGHVAPVLEFLRKTLMVDCKPATLAEALAKGRIPPSVFGARLERTLAPRHAFLCAHPGILPSGADLLEIDTTSTFRKSKLSALLACRSDGEFARLCCEWSAAAFSSHTPHQCRPVSFSAAAVARFSVVFRRGLFCAARGELMEDLAPFGINAGTVRGRRCQIKSGLDLVRIAAASADAPLVHACACSSFVRGGGQVISLQLSHGADPRGSDGGRGNLLHVACGAGCLPAAAALAAHAASAMRPKRNPVGSTALPPTGGGAATAADAQAVAAVVACQRDASGASPLHWAAAGSSARGGVFVGGRPEAVSWLLSQGADPNAQTQRYTCGCILS